MVKLQTNVERVRERIAAACARSSRHERDVRLIGVTKSVGAEVARELFQLGVTELAESRPQELWSKAAAIPQATWHLIGHLQRNKIEKTIPVAAMIHSVDSVRLLEALDAECGRVERRLPILLEVNASREENKHGFAPDELPSLIDRFKELRWLEPRGLMTMAAFREDPEACRPTFAEVRSLRDRLAERMPTCEELSMGMSNDFEVAIEEGATMVRLGTILFE